MRKTQPGFASLEMEDWVCEPRKANGIQEPKSEIDSPWGPPEEHASADTLILGQ